MNTEELKEALLLLQKEQPEFLIDLVGHVIKENLTINSDTVGWQGETVYVLNWKEAEYTYKEFSRAY